MVDVFFGGEEEGGRGVENIHPSYFLASKRRLHIIFRS